MPRITYDRWGTPGVWAANETEAYAGLGWLHGRHRPLQALLLAAGGRGDVAAHILPRADLVALDALANRLGLPERGRAEAQRLDEETAAWLDAYLLGFEQGLRAGGMPFELRVLCARLPALDRAAVLSGLMLAAYLGLAQCQERMERALVDAVAAGANPGLLEKMFHPHLATWDPQRLAALPRRADPGLASYALLGGSNAWAVDGSRSHSGHPILCGDPHLRVNQLPALFFEVRARVGDEVWLGATLPGLPGWFLGRNRRVAWSGTFAVADNVDFFIETLEGGQARRPRGWQSLVRREVEIGRRFRSPVKISFLATDHGVLEKNGDGDTLAVQWCGGQRASEMLAVYMRLTTTRSAAEATALVDRAPVFSLHLIFADRREIRYAQAGRVPRRSGGWSGLHPVPSGGEAGWRGFYEPGQLPRAVAEDGMLVSANEARAASDGGVLSTLAQPWYRYRRIAERLRARADHDVASMQQLQLDLLSPQAMLLTPRWLKNLRPGPARAALEPWDHRFDIDSRGAHAFDLCYRAAVRALSPELGGDWFLHMLEQSEMPVWWLAGIDRILANPTSWQGERGERLAAAVAEQSPAEPAAWGEVQQLTLENLVLAGLPRWAGFDRGPFPLAGSVATVQQGNRFVLDGQHLTIGQGYRMVCDLSTDVAWTALPGGVDGSRFSDTYDCWLREFLDGGYHQLAAPADEERA
jgi:penicillin amidase